jgi:hypothetical protein
MQQLVGEARGEEARVSATMSAAFVEVVDPKKKPVSHSSAAMCCARAPLPPPQTKPKKFEIDRLWAFTCATEAHPENGVSWKDPNSCWAWTKRMCYEKGGNISWRDAQSQVGHLSPTFEEQPMGLGYDSVCDRPENGAALVVTKEETLAARKWFREHVSVYVLNLRSEELRLKTISARLTELGVAFTRVPGVDLTQPGALDDARQRGFVPKTYDYAKAAANGKLVSNSMQGIAGSMGCGIGHLGALEKAHQDWAAQEQLSADLGPPEELALILEDDVRLSDDFMVRLMRLIEDEVPCDWEALSLRSMCPYGDCLSPHLSRVRPDGNEPYGRCYHGVNYGFYAMLYQRSKLGRIRHLLSETMWEEDRPRCLDIDVALASISDDLAYYAVPGSQYPSFLSFFETSMDSKRSQHNGDDIAA